VSKRARPSGRVAILGTGMVAPWHLEAWQQAGAIVVAAADVNERALHAFAESYNIAHRHTDFRVLLAEQGDAFDIVDICVPPWLHAPMALASLEAGKHVICEKPFALSSIEAAAMAGAADRAGKVLACRQGSTRLHHTARTVRDVVISGQLGEIYFMRLVGRTLYRPGIEYNPSARWFLDRTKAGGGVLYDWGVYDLDLLFSIFGPLDVAEVMALTFQGVDSPELEVPYNVEEHAVALLKLRHGPSIFWERAWATHLPSEVRWDLYGTKAGLSFLPHSDQMGPDVQMNLTLTRYAPETAELLPTPPMAAQGPSVYEDFLQAVAGKRQLASPGREQVAMLRIIEAVYASAEAGHSVSLAPDSATPGTATD
jgi:predicted dehydrogenase